MDAVLERAPANSSVRPLTPKKQAQKTRKHAQTRANAIPLFSPNIGDSGVQKMVLNQITRNTMCEAGNAFYFRRGAMPKFEVVSTSAKMFVQNTK